MGWCGRGSSEYEKFAATIIRSSVDQINVSAGAYGAGTVRIHRERLSRTANDRYIGVIAHVKRRPRGFENTDRGRRLWCNQTAHGEGPHILRTQAGEQGHEKHSDPVYDVDSKHWTSQACRRCDSRRRTSRSAGAIARARKSARYTGGCCIRHKA